MMDNNAVMAWNDEGLIHYTGSSIRVSGHKHRLGVGKWSRKVLHLHFMTPEWSLEVNTETRMIREFRSRTGVISHASNNMMVYGHGDERACVFKYMPFRRYTPKFDKDRRCYFEGDLSQVTELPPLEPWKKYSPDENATPADPIFVEFYERFLQLKSLADDFVHQKLDSPVFLEDHELYNVIRNVVFQFNEARVGRDVFAY